ncbi:oligosaccharide flippase family protein [Parabacteroides sp. FAFU027]|uniref:oligosaccharide flippase family protein n=1 Tax=Parabacteroides sp. FAFU027 TaxID=2922715 RepID=UPI001FB01350|nr:oligosaccharide flippase family protein [Parabacteroides sp. FAFU027]
MSEKNSYNSILKTTGLVGLVQIIAILLGIIRTKCIAIILGTGGFGVFSLYNSLLDFMSNTCQFGIGAGGVRQLALEKSDERQNEVEKIVFILKTWIIGASSVAALLMILFSKEISLFQFKNDKYSLGIIFISFAVLFSNIYNINIIILNGVREIKAMAKVQVMAAVWGVIVALPILYFFRQKGIELSILAVFIVNSIVSALYIRKLGIKSILPTKSEYIKHFKPIIGIGISYAIPGIINTCLLYVARFYLKEIFSFEVLGIYQACIVLSTLYVQTIVSAMGVEFLPSLMSVRDNDQLINKKAAEQMELGLLLGSIGVIATFAFAPYILQLFYNHDFIQGTSILRWQIMAVLLRVLEWPLGYTTTAKGKSGVYMTLQIFYLFFDFGMLYLFTRLWGFNGLGMCHFVAYTIFFIVRYYSVKKITGFVFTPLLRKIFLTICIFVTLLVLNTIFIKDSIALFISLFILVISCLWSNKVLKEEMNINMLLMMKRFIKSKS